MTTSQIKKAALTQQYPEEERRTAHGGYDTDRQFRRCNDGAADRIRKQKQDSA
jgi:hypothetical protein